MNDLQLMNLGLIRLEELLEGLSVDAELVMVQLLTRYRDTKEALAAVVAGVDAASVCRECVGQCCLNGKYRLNVFDALARITANIPTSADFSKKPACPYGTASGCTMEAGFRPADCVLFICEAIDHKLPPQARLILAAQELILRECIEEASRLTAEPAGSPLLLWAAHAFKSNI